MQNKRIFMIARDAAPSSTFKILEPELVKTGIKPSCILGHGDPLDVSNGQIEEEVNLADVVLLGMSSSARLAEPEIFAGKTSKKTGKIYGFFGDIPNCWGRAGAGNWFEEIAEEASFYFGVSQVDADAAREVFQNAKLIGTGNPLRENMAFPKLSREEARLRLGIGPDEILIQASGGKLSAGTMAFFVVIIEALGRIAKKGKKFQLILGIHPGDRAVKAIDESTKEELSLYEALIPFSSIPTRVVTKEQFSGSEILPGADLIIHHNSMIGIEAAFQNKPIISLGFDILNNRYQKTNGKKTFEDVENKVARYVDAEVTELVLATEELITETGFAPYRKMQQKYYPKPEKRGAATEKIIKELKAFLNF